MPATTILAAIGVTAASVGATAYAAAVFAINFAVSYTLNRVFGAKPSRPTDNGARQQIPPSADNRLPVAYGEAWMGGTFVDAVMTGDNQAMYYVLAISHISPDGQFTYDTTKFYYGDRLITFAPGTNRVQSLTDGNGNIDTKIDGYLYFNLYTSTAAGVITTAMGLSPSAAMGGIDIPIALRWPATGRQMNGLAFAIVYLKYNTEAGTTGLQPITFRIKHALNGTGVAKPGSVLKDYLTSTVYGGAIPVANVDTVACADLDTYSDQNITYTPSGGGSATQVRYRINGVLDTGETVLNNIDHILTACDSWLAYQADTGQWSPVINKAESVTFAFNDSNIIGEIRVSATDINSSINQVEVSFPWKENKDQPATVFMKLPTALMYPNEPVNKYTATFNLVNDSVQAQYLANRMLEQAREDLIVSFSTAYTGIQVNAGDVVSVTNTDYGWSAKPFRVIKVNETSLPDGNLGARVELSEYNSAVYDDGTITSFVAAPNSDLTSAYFFSALSAPTTADIVTNSNTPSFSVNVAIPATGRVTTVYLYYTTSASPTTSDWREWGNQSQVNSVPYNPSSTLKFANVVLPPGNYYFAYKVANEKSFSLLSPSSSAFAWQTTVPGQAITYSTSDAGPVAITQLFFTPDGYTRNTNFVGITFTSPYTGVAVVTIDGAGNFVNASAGTTYVRWSIQQTGGTWDNNARVTNSIVTTVASDATSFPVAATRTFNVTAGTSYTIGGWGAKFVSGDTFTISNLRIVVTITNQ